MLRIWLCEYLPSGQFVIFLPGGDCTLIVLAIVV